MRISALPAIALALATGLVFACSQEEPTVQEGPDAPEGITVSNGRIMLPAVQGNPAVLYFDVANSSQRTTVIRAVDVQGAESAMLHQTSTGPGGETSMAEMIQATVHPTESLSFEPGGMHVMVMKPGETIVAGGTTEVTLTFVGGDKVSFPAEIRAAGDDR